tara:strand:+ start:1452 stop:2021 length:570 start_codon:yes stop_codon:yes gene_type:complete
MISLIVAYDENRVIGNQGDIPWRISEDFKHFKRTTSGHPIIMGRKTWDSLPKKPLPGRMNIVVTRDPDRFHLNWLASNHGWIVGGAENDTPFAVNSIKEAIKLAGDKDVFIIGGSEIYKSAIDAQIVDRVIASEVDGTHEGDVYFPKLGAGWRGQVTQEYDNFKIVEYRRINYEDESRRIRGEDGRVVY